MTDNPQNHPVVREHTRFAPMYSSVKMHLIASEFLLDFPDKKNLLLKTIESNQVQFYSEGELIVIYFDWMKRDVYSFINGEWHSKPFEHFKECTPA
jgi:hypothetical protein